MQFTQPEDINPLWCGMYKYLHMKPNAKGARNFNLDTRSPTLAILPSYRVDKWNSRRRECKVQLCEFNCDPLRKFYGIRIVLTVLRAFQLSHAIRSSRITCNLVLYITYPFKFRTTSFDLLETENIPGDFRKRSIYSFRTSFIIQCNTNNCWLYVT